MSNKTYSKNVLPLMEGFHTIQGEGFHTGKAAYFIRLGGCDVGCHWCDVKESWDATKYQLLPVDLIVENAAKYPSKNVVVTGGEPLLHSLDYLTAALKEKGIKTCIETSGAHPLSGTWDWICLSPKKFKPPQPVIISQANELKVVVFNRSDFSWAEAYASLVSAQCQLYLQPEWSRCVTVAPLIVDYVLRHPKWQISLQIHKYLNIP